MADNKIKHKRNVTNSNAATSSDIDIGELAIGAVSGKLFIRKTDNSIVTFSDTTTAVQANTDEAVALAIALG